MVAGDQDGGRLVGVLFQPTTCRGDDNLYLAFWRVPLVDEMDSAEALAAPETTMATGTGRALLIDDEEVARDVVIDMLETLGYEPVAYDSAVSALEYYQRSWSEVDVVILDMIMPDMHGLEAFRAVKTINPEAAVVIISGHSRRGEVERTLQEGARGFLQKPFAAAQLRARFDARRRRYRYTIYNWRTRSPLARRTSLHVSQPLDVAAMSAAAGLLVGKHDFATFGRPPKGTNTVRHVFAAEWSGAAPWLTFHVEATAFLYRMVRSMVGTMLDVGRGRITVERFGQILASCDRAEAGPTAPAHGLCLVEVRYGEPGKSFGDFCVGDDEGEELRNKAG